MKRILLYARSFLESLRVALSAASAYRANFALSSVIMLLSNLAFPFATLLIYGAGAGFPGWNFWEVLLMQGIYTIANGFAQVFFQGIFWVTNFSIREGTFEKFLLKPVRPLFAIMMDSIRFEAIGMIVGGGILTAVAIYKTGPVSTPSALACAALFVGGICVLFGITAIMAATSFKWVGNSRIPEIFNSALNFGKYPLGIFPAGAQAVATFVVPVAMIGFFPASALLGRAEPGHFLALIPCVLFMTAGIAFYGSMVHLYESAGG
jgi:ABC-2 type transport system permease protein